MYGVVVGADKDGYGEVYATFGTAAECFDFIRRGKTMGLPPRIVVVRNPYDDKRDAFGKRCPPRKVLNKP